MLPSMTFSPACRSTLNGISAASGKAGALIGAILFEPAASRFGNDKVMLMCACLSFCGMIMTMIGVKSDVGHETSLPGKSNGQSKLAMPKRHSAPSLLDFS